MIFSEAWEQLRGVSVSSTELFLNFFDYFLNFLEFFLIIFGIFVIFSEAWEHLRNIFVSPTELS